MPAYHECAGDDSRGVDQGGHRRPRVRGSQIVEAVGEQYVDVDITYAHQRERRGLAHAVWQARNHIDGPYVVLNVDIIIGTLIAPSLDPVRCGDADVAILVQDVTAEVSTRTAAVAVECGLITDIVEKPDAAPGRTEETTCC